MSTTYARRNICMLVGALWAAFFVVSQYPLMVYAQNGRTSAGSSPTLEDGNREPGSWRIHA